MKVNIRLRIISTIILSITIYGFCSYIFPKNHENIMLRNYQFAKKFDRTHKSDILFIGNSRIECGINTIPISKKTGLSCYNLGIPRTTFNSKNYFDFVWSKLDTNNFPIIVVGLSPSTIMYYPERDGISNEAMIIYQEKPKYDWFKERYLYKYLTIFEPLSPIQILFYLLGREYWYSYREYKLDGWKKSYDYPMNEFRTSPMFKEMYKKRKVNFQQYELFLDVIKN